MKHIHGGKVKLSQTRKGQNRAARHALRGVKPGAEHELPRLLHEALRSRLGAPMAITATAFKLARIIDNVMHCGVAYNRQAAFIRTLYAVEQEIQDALEKLGDQFANADVVRMTRTRAGPILATFCDWLDEQLRSATPKCLFGQAIEYSRNQ